MGCRGSAEKRQLLRIVRAGEAFVLDVRQVAPGRGAYLHPGCGARALRTRALTRALGGSGGATDRLASLVDEVDATASAWENSVLVP